MRYQKNKVMIPFNGWFIFLWFKNPFWLKYCIGNHCNLFVLDQEYPPGVMLFPMRSLTGAPFRTTNLVVMVPNNDGINKCKEPDCIAYGDALLMDPGCCTLSHSEVYIFKCLVRAFTSSCQYGYTHFLSSSWLDSVILIGETYLLLERVLDNLNSTPSSTPITTYPLSGVLFNLSLFQFV